MSHATFFETGSQKTLAVRRMPSPHTADRLRELVDAILEEWDLSISKVKEAVTDKW